MTTTRLVGVARRLAAAWAAPLVVGALVAWLLVGRPVLGGRTPEPALNTGTAPWGVPNRGAERARAARLPSFRELGGRPHAHAHLDVFVDGAAVVVPEGIGLAPATALHTHSPSGIIHMETSRKDARFTLGQLFTVWGVRLDDRCVGGYCAPARVYVNGVERRGPIASIALDPYSEIALVVGAPPPSIPASYDCRGAAEIELSSCEGFLHPHS